MLDAFLLDPIIDMIFCGILGIIGAIVKYVHDVHEKKDTSFHIGGVLANAIMGCGVGMIMSSFLTEDIKYREGLLIIFGFMADTLLKIVDKRSRQIIEKVLGRSLSR